MFMIKVLIEYNFFLFFINIVLYKLNITSIKNVFNKQIQMSAIGDTF